MNRRHLLQTLVTLSTVAALSGATSAAWAVTDASWADGEVKRIDTAAGKLQIKHGPIASLNMPPMTMLYKVKDASMLSGLAVGQLIRFKAEKIDGQYVVTAIEKA
jgi:Cu/Ag efflux protein CusF